jgi:hypothetical protein
MDINYHWHKYLEKKEKVELIKNKISGIFSFSYAPFFRLKLFLFFIVKIQQNIEKSFFYYKNIFNLKIKIRFLLFAPMLF